MAGHGFWRDRRVLVTGHTGFKGAWLTTWLGRLGAEVHGLALPPEPGALFERLGGAAGLAGSTIGDLRDPAVVRGAVDAVRPEVVLHLAAQSLVRRSYREPLATMAVNLMGMAGLFEALRAGAPELRAVLVATTDKVYRNLEQGRAFAEADPLGGHDPYSASKAAAEILTESWGKSFFEPAGVALATARAGNVIGGGDVCEDRLVPDLWRAARAGVVPELRNPASVRPWQWVMEPLRGYLDHAEALCGPAAPHVPRALNFGPAIGETVTVGETADRFLEGLGWSRGWRRAEGPQPHEAGHLALDSSLAERALGWRARLPAFEAIDWTAAWYKEVDDGADPRAVTLAQIERYEALAR